MPNDDTVVVSTSNSRRLVPADHMLMSMAPVEESAVAVTVVASSPAVNSFRISKSRSTEGGRSKWTARNRPFWRTTAAFTKPTSAIKTRAISPALVANARVSSAVIAAPVSDMSLIRPVDSAPLAAKIEIGSSSSKRSYPRLTGAWRDIIHTRNRTTTLTAAQQATIGSKPACPMIRHSD
jgi:hypothetical protein